MPASSARSSPRPARGARPLPPPDRRRLVPLLRRPRAQARRLLLPAQPQDQRRPRPARLLLRETEGVLRHVLRHLGPVLTATLVAAALAAGVTGAWSPCGLSMVDTLAPQGFARRLRTSIAACATFALGALAGGAITFGGLALFGAALGAGGPAALGVAAVVAVAAAAA